MPIGPRLESSELERYCELAHQEARRILRNRLLAAEVGDEACFELVLLYAKNTAPVHPAAWTRTIVRRLRCKILGKPRAKETGFSDGSMAGLRWPHELRSHVLADEWARRRELLQLLEPRLLGELTGQQARIFRLLCADWSVKRIAKQLGIGPKDVRDVRRVVVKKAHALLEKLNPPPSPPFDEGKAPGRGPMDAQ